MALSKLKYNSLNVTATASKAVGFDSGADDLAATFSGGSMIFIKKLTASASSTLSFVDGSASVVLDNTYKEYFFTFNNIHPADNQIFHFQGSIDSGSNYNIAMTTTIWMAFHGEADTDASVGYESSHDQAQGTAFQRLGKASHAGADNSISGTLHIFNPSSTTYTKHFIAETSNYNGNTHAGLEMTAGYFNTTSAIDAVQFKMASGNMDAGDICLYGIS